MFQIRLDMGEKLTIQKRVKLVFMFGKNGATYRSVAEECSRSHAQREKPLDQSTVFHLIKRFQETGSVADLERVVHESVQLIKNHQLWFCRMSLEAP